MAMEVFRPVFFFCSIFLTFSHFSISIDTLKPNQTLADNGESLVSAGESFELGFFSPSNSDNRYVGIWFKNVPQRTVVWVANRNNPVSDSIGIVMITSSGNMILLNNQSGVPVWFSNSSSTTSYNSILQLLDNGNLVVKDSVSGNYIWQSFDHPGDTLIPGMKLGVNLMTNQNWYLTSWKSIQDPSDGDYMYMIDTRGLPQTVLHKGTDIVYRSGPWDGVRFGGGPPLLENTIFKPIFVSNSSFVYYSYLNVDETKVSRFVVNQSGLLQHLTWNQRRGQWVDIATLQTDQCDAYERCGPNSICKLNQMGPPCQCLTGFVPKVPQDWQVMVWSSGCIRRTPLNCSTKEGFRKFSQLKLPDNSHFSVNKTEVTLEECKEVCLRDCSCTAYTRTEVSSCVTWYRDLLDVRVYDEGGHDLYIKMAASDLGSNKKNKTVAIVSVSLVFACLLIAVTWYVIRKRASRKRKGDRLSDPIQDNSANDGEEDLDQLPLYDFSIVMSATNNFSYTNKIGEGGFGIVYKGELTTGQEIAVKRLSKDSGQGLKEFKNEVIFISKLQHRNLVRLLGCCIHGEERMLLYEYMPKKSLDLYLYNQTRGTSLDWNKRFDIIVGIARGLLYLHRDSRLRIIHRDLKASNILLDDKMDPKISDFGLARTFAGDQNEDNTKRVMGTYGYMPPEYAIDGLFSVKSDVFSFGVLVLEIVSGKKNRGFYHPDHDHNLLGHAWRLWIEGKPLELTDAVMEKPVLPSELLRCIHVGLLCVQQRPEDRPTMSSIVLLLDSNNPILPQPKQPGFYTERFLTETDSSSTARNFYTPNELTVTMLQGR